MASIAKNFPKRQKFTEQDIVPKLPDDVKAELAIRINSNFVSLRPQKVQIER